MTKNSIWIVIPGYNESKSLTLVLQSIKKYTHNIIFVDDGSSDHSLKIAQKNIKYSLRHRLNLGKGAALKTGAEFAFKHLKAEAIIFMDSDRQHRAEDLSFFFEALKKSEVVFAERAFNTKMPFLRRLSNRILSMMVYFLFGIYFVDIPCGFKALSKRAYQKICWQASDYSVELEIAAKVAKYKIPYQSFKIPVIYHDLGRGMTFIDGMRVCIYLLNLKLLP